MNIGQWRKQGLELVHEIEQEKIAANHLAIWYLGQCGFIIKTIDCIIGIDLVLSELYDAQGNPRRLYQPPFSPAEAPSLTHLFCSHSHADHLDPPTVKGILENHQQTICIIPGGIASIAGALPQERLVYAIQGVPLPLSPTCSVLPIMVAHESYELDNDKSKFLGYLFQTCNLKFFHSGDTILDTKLTSTIQESTPIDVMMLPINGTDMLRKKAGIIGNMNAFEAALLAKIGESKLAIPMHFDMFANNGANPNTFVDEATKAKAPYSIWIPKLGEKITIPCFYQG